MAKRKITYLIDVDESGAVKGTRKVERGFEDVDKTAKKTSGNLERYAARAGTALVAGLGLAFAAATHKAIQEGREFESQLAELEAITGITGRQLERLGDRSLELSKIYGASASNIIEANKLVASQLAEKIDFGTEEGFQQLQRVSEQAVVLAKAARIDLSEAVATTTSVINQFNLEASESERVINTLAAGSKYGAAEVPAIGAALVNAGAAAAGAGQEIETVNAAIQVLAMNGQVGERAGTALRAIFTRLKTESQALAEAGIKNVDIEANGLAATLRQLEPLLEDTAAAKKIFGEEALNQIQILVRNADAVESLTEKVTGTQVANEQAAVNMDTFDGAMDRLWTTIDSQLIPAFTANEGVMKSGLEVVIDWVDETGNLVSEMNRLSSIVGTKTTLLHKYADSWWNVWSPAGGFLQDIRDVGVWTGLIDNLDSVQEYLEEIDAGTEQITGHIGDLTSTVQHFSEQQKGLSEDSDLYQFYARGIEQAQNQINNLRRAFNANLDSLREQRRETEHGTTAYGKLSEEIRQMEIALAALGSSEEDISAIIAAANEERENEKDAVNNLSTEMKDLKGRYEELIHMPNLDQAGLFEAAGIRARIIELEELIQKRKEATTLDTSDPFEGDSFNVTAEISSDADEMQDQVTEEERAAHQERMAMLDEQKMTEIETQQEAAKATQKAQEQKMKAYGDAAASAIMYADSVGEGVKMVIEALTAEIITRAILAAFQPPTPASLVLAPVLAAGASRLIGSLIPDFAYGGLAYGPSHEQGGIYGMIGGKPALELEGGEAIINKRSTAMFLPELSAMNRAGGGVPLAQDGALTFNAIGRGSASELPMVGSGGGDIASAIREGMEGVIVEARVAISELDEKLTRYQENQADIGN